MAIDCLELRLKAVADAQATSRYVLVTGIFLSFAFVLAAWNSYLSWDRWLVQEWKNQEAAGAAPQEALTKDLRKAHASDWIAHRSIAVSPIGLSVGVHDIVPVCVAVMTTVAVWMLFAIKREVRIYRSFAEDKTLTLEDRQLARSAISDHSLFFEVEAVRLKDDGVPRRRIIPVLIAFTPILTIVVAFVGDVASIFMRDVFEKRGTMLEVIIGSPQLLAWLLLVYAGSVLGAWLCYQICKKTLEEFNEAERIARTLGTSAEGVALASPLVSEGQAVPEPA